MNVPSFLDHLGQSYVSYINSSNWSEFKNSAIYCMSPAIPSVRRSGDIKFPPPLSDPSKVTLILCNHQSDLDQFLVFTSTTFRDDSKVPVQLTGFTHEGFKTLPGIGQMVGKNLIGLDKGDSKITIQAKIKKFLHQGFNTFLLFPEGTFLHKNSLLKSHAFQKSPTFHKVLYPRFGAFDAFVELLQDRIEYVVDLTLDYPGYNPSKAEWSYFTYPSVAHSFLNQNRVPPPYLHASCLVVNGKWETLTHDFVLKLWKKKEHRLQIREKRELESQYPYLFKTEE